MTSIPSRDLRNDTKRVLDRVRDGEDVVITVNGRPVARITPLEERPTWMARHAFVARLPQADAGLTEDLRSLAPDTTDDLGAP